MMEKKADRGVFLSIVIPTYNEEGRIGGTLEEIRKYLDSKPFRSEIIISDDGSTDRTDEIVNNFKSKFNIIVTVGDTVNHGKGYAVREGMLSARGRYVIFADADSATPIQEADKILKALEENDVAICSRYMEGSQIVTEQPWFRRFAGKMARLLIRVVILPGIRDTQCGFKGFRRESARKIFSKQTIVGWGFDMEILAIARKNGYKVVEVPSVWHHRGASKIHFFRDFFLTLRDLIKIKANVLKGKYVD